MDRAQGKLRSEFAHMCDRNQSEKCLTTNYKKEPILDDPALAWVRVQGSSLQSVKGPRLQLMLLCTLRYKLQHYAPILIFQRNVGDLKPMPML